MKPSIKLFLDNRRTKQQGKYPVKLQIIFQRKVKLYPVGLDLTAEEFEFVMNQGAGRSVFTAVQKRALNEARAILSNHFTRANEIINHLVDFSFEQFERKLNQKKLAGTDVFQYYEAKIMELREKERISTADTYRNTLSNLKLFRPKLTFRDITIQFLEDFERWLLQRGRTISTVGINLRTLRAIMNDAIADGIISKETNYPFGKRLYQIPAGRNIKKALSMQEIGKLYHYRGFPGTWFEKARDFFIFSYLGNGINMRDIALLKNSCIQGETLCFVRAKTQHTYRTSTPTISIYLTPELLAIIERQRSLDRSPDAYLFPILTHKMDAETRNAKAKQFVRNVNDNLCKIAEELGIEKKVTTYFARHSFATVLKRNGTSTEMISESLGHSNLKTTAAYLDSFEDEHRKEMVKVLTMFENEGLPS